MSKNLNKQDQLRTAAEAQLAHAPKPKPRPAEKLLHELQVHQIELEMQNEQLRQAQVELEKSRDRYVDFYDFAPAGYLTLNHEGMIDEINLTGAALLGVERGKLPYHRFISFVATDDRDRWYRHFLNILTHDNTPACELALQHDGGARSYARLDCLRLKKDGKESVVRIVLTNITGRKAAEDALEESNRFFSTLAQISPVGIFRTDAQGSCVYVNERWCKITGMKQNTALGAGWAQTIHPDDRKQVTQAWYTSAQAQQHFLMEYRIQRPNDVTRWVLGQAASEQDAAGNVVGYVGTITDITQSKQDEKELQIFFNVTPDLVCIASTDGRFLKINPMWQETLGYPEQEILSKPFLDLIHPEDRNATMKEVERQLAGEATVQFINRYRCKDGSYRWLEWRATPAADKKLLFASARDITERKRTEEALQEALNRFQKIAQLAPGIVFQFRLRPDGSSCVPYASEATRDIYRLTPEEIREDASRIFTHVHPDDLENFMASIPASARNLAPWQQEYRLKFGNGTVRWLFGNALPQREADGSTLWHGFITDITERKLAEKAAAQREALFRNYFELGQIGMAITSPDQEWLQVNHRLCEMLGYTKEELTRMTWVELTHPADLEPDLVQFKRLLSGEIGRYAMDKRFIHKNGSIVYTYLTVSCQRKPDGAVEYFIASLEDITERKQAEQSIAESTSRFREIFNTVNDAIFIHDAETGRIIDVNHRMCEMYGLTREEALACGPDDLSTGTPPYSSAEAIEKIRLAHTEGPQTFDWLARARDGHLFWVEVSLRFALIGSQQRILAVVRNISERKQAEAELRIAAIAFETQEGMMVTDAHSVILRVNHAFTEITGYTAEEAVGQTPHLLKSGRHDAAFYAAIWESLRRTGVWQGEVWNRRKNGEVYPEHLTITAVKGDNGEITHYVATMSDITMRKQAEEQIRNLAFYDSLTQLPNRRLLNDRLEQTMAASKRSGRYDALMFLDLDNFKPLNDAHGHDVGDLLLVEVARRISSCVREVDTVARFGGDEFMVMLGELDVGKAESATQAAIVAEKIRAILAEPYLLKIQQNGKAEMTVEYHCTSSIGVVLFINHQASTEEIIKWADMAMYQAKEAGGNLIRFHE